MTKQVEENKKVTANKFRKLHPLAFKLWNDTHAISSYDNIQNPRWFLISYHDIDIASIYQPALHTVYLRVPKNMKGRVTKSLVSLTWLSPIKRLCVLISLKPDEGLNGLKIIACSVDKFAGLLYFTTGLNSTRDLPWCARTNWKKLALMSTLSYPDCSISVDKRWRWSLCWLVWEFLVWDVQQVHLLNHVAVVVVIIHSTVLFLFSCVFAGAKWCYILVYRNFWRSELLPGTLGCAFCSCGQQPWCVLAGQRYRLVTMSVEWFSPLPWLQWMLLILNLKVFTCIFVIVRLCEWQALRLTDFSLTYSFLLSPTACLWR